MHKPFFAISTALLALALAAGDNGLTHVAAASPDPSPATPAAGQSAAGRSLQIRDSSAHRTYACQGEGVDSVQVTGSADVLAITGRCGSLQVTGSSNAITIDSITTIQFTGNSNSVLWRGAGPTTVDDHGRSNSVARATGPITAAHGNTVPSDDETSISSKGNDSTAAGDSVGATVSAALQAANAASQSAAAVAGTVQGVQTQGNMLNIILSNQRTTQDCGDGKNVDINGYQNDITLTGSCGKVILNGWGNTIRIEEVAAIEIGGHTNTLTWERGRNARRPAVQIDSGMNNSVRHLTPASQ
jgi:hypothetical protein